jgi:hypothetical protein
MESRKKHPNYNHHDGTYAGLPKGLKKLWEKTETFTKKVCNALSKDEGVELINKFTNDQKQQTLFN